MLPNKPRGVARLNDRRVLNDIQGPGFARSWLSPSRNSSILLVTTGIIIGASAISVLNAQSNAPYLEVAADNVTDQAGYEASGVDKVRDAIKAGGGKLIAGGYNKATTLEGDVPAANRFLIFEYPSKLTRRCGLTTLSRG